MTKSVDASAKLTVLTRLGFATRGLLYCAIGFLVIGAGRNEDPAGALQYLGNGAGQPLLLIMVAGLVAYGVWRISDAAFNVERHDSDRKGMVERIGAATSGIAHLFLAWQAVRLIQDLKSISSGSQENAQAALQLPGGAALLMAVGVVLIGVGVLQLYKAWKATFLSHLEAEIARRPWALWSGRAGYAARGLVLILIGVFALKAGIQEQASGVGGMAQALAWLSSPLDMLVAAGLFCFGVFSLIEARYRKLHDVPVDGIFRRVTGR